jgi:aminotransferase
MGAKVAEFEQQFSERLGSDFVMVDSGSNALYMAVKLLDLPPGSEILLPSFTWVACAHAIILAGHRVVFADVDADTQNIDASQVERAITNATKAIMAVHYAGRPVRLDELASFGLPIIEDAAHAVDSMLNGRRCGTIGTLGTFSFDAIKNLATPDGGGLTSRSPELMERMKRMRYWGMGKSGFDSVGSRDRWWRYEICDVLPKLLPNDVSASIALAQLAKLTKHQRRRRSIWDTYQAELKDLEWLVRPGDPASDEQHSYFTYLIRVLDGRRDVLARSLMAAGIYTTLRYQPLHLYSIYGSTKPLPNSESLAEQGLNLPLHPRLTDNDVGRVIDAIRRF